MSADTDERRNARAQERRLGLARRLRFEDYCEKYAEDFVMERHNGVLEVRMHTKGGPVTFSRRIHNAWPQLWIDIGNDPDNELLIFSGTGDQWTAGYERDPDEPPLHAMESDLFYDQIYWDVTKSLEAFIFNIDIPTIACINGPGLHTELALMCDITLCADHTILYDPHFADFALVPGDGQGMAFQQLMGIKRSAYYLYTSDRIDALTAQQLGLVNEVLPLDSLMPRAREIAARIMTRPRDVRRFTSAMIRRPWKRLLVDDLGFQVTHELLAMRLQKRM